MSEHTELLGELAYYENVREAARRVGDWDAYGAACERLAHLAKRIELNKQCESSH